MHFAMEAFLNVTIIPKGSMSVRTAGALQFRHAQSLALIKEKVTVRRANVVVPGRP